MHGDLEITSALDYFLEICPATDERCQRLYAGAIENGGLLATDFFTLRDWLEATEYQGHPSLHALLLLLLLALEEGSLCLEWTEANCRRRLENLVSAEDAGWWADRIQRDLEQNDFSRLISSDGQGGTPLVRQTIHGQDFLFFQKYLRHEKNLLQAFEHILGPELSLPADHSLSTLRAILEEVLREKPLRAQGRPLELDPDQRTALGLVLLRPFVTISGGPGTGKTSLVLTLLRCLTRCGIPPERILLAAPTGRAAQRLGDSLRAGLATLGERSPADQGLTSVQPTTLHQLLGFLPGSGSFRRHVENPIPADVVIVDEVSMVGLSLMAQLLHAVAPETRLVLIGDKDQLPSVDAGAVLAHLLPEGFQPDFSTEMVSALGSLFPGHLVQTLGPNGDLTLFDRRPLRDTVALLRTNHRSEQNIQEAAQAINRRDTEVLTRLPRLSLEEIRKGTDPWKGEGCFFLPSAGTSRELAAVLAGWARHAYLEAATQRGSYPALVQRCRLHSKDDYDEEAKADLRDLFSLVDRARLLTLVREGPWGCVEINRFLERQLGESQGRRREYSLVPGSPVLIGQNDHVRKLFNGDVGLALIGVHGGLRVVFHGKDGFRSFPLESLPAHELGFALTVHKSQGSEYDEVLLVFPPEGARRLLTRELVYTAVTRAKRMAVLYGKEEVIRQAISRRVEREAGWLRTLQGM